MYCYTYWTDIRVIFLISAWKKINIFPHMLSCCFILCLRRLTYLDSLKGQVILIPVVQCWSDGSKDDQID